MNKIEISSKAKKIAIIVCLLFLAILIGGFSKSYGAEEYVQTVTVYINRIPQQSDIVYVYNVVDGNAEIVRIRHDSVVDNFDIPDNLNGYPVVSIGDGEKNIFGDRTVFDGTFEKVFTLPSSLKKINAHAFEEVGIFRINLSNVEEIGDYAFYKALMCYPNEKDFNVNDHDKYELDLSNVKVIGKYAFARQESKWYAGWWIGQHVWYSYDAQFKSIKFSDSIEEIGDGAFSGNSLLKEVRIPSNIKKIGNHAFSECTGLDNLIIEDRDTQLEIGDYALSKTGFTSVDITEIMTLGKGVFVYCENLVEATINNGRTEIPQETFNSCFNLINIKNPDTNQAPSSITTIGDEAFAYTGIDTNEYNDIVKNVTTIGNRAFEFCRNLTGKVTIKDIATNLGEGIFNHCQSITEAEILPEITKIPNSTYEFCTSLNKVTKPNTVTTIGEKAFSNCTSLPLDQLCNNVLTNIKDIQAYAFTKCTGLIGEFTLLQQIETIGEGAFSNCTGLTDTLTIYGNIKNIGDKAFINCLNVKNIVFNSNVETIGDSAFYLTAQNQGIIELPNSITSIGEKAFHNLKEVFIQKDIHSISTGYKWYGKSNARIHGLNCNHTINVKCTLPGVSLVALNGSQLPENVSCKSNYAIKLVVDDAHKNDYQNGLFIRVLTEGQTKDDRVVEEYITLDENNSYIFENVTRNSQIIVQRTNEGTNLVLRGYISEINGSSKFTTRKPYINVQTGIYGLKTIDYNHTKYPMAVEAKDKITYTIRVYNEGKVAGKANEISVRIPNNLKLIEDDEINQYYGWTLSTDGTYATTRYLEDKEIAPFEKQGRPEYEEIEVVCQVGSLAETAQYMALVAEITDGNDMDSMPNSTFGMSLSNYMKEQAEASTTDTYLKGEEDDTDFEAITLRAAVKVGYRLVIKKIDSTSKELLNGAKFELLDKDKNLIKSGIVDNGTLDFGEISSYGEGTDIYYLNEVETPVGYERTMEGMVELQVIKTIDVSQNVNVQIAYKVAEREDDLQEIDREIEKIFENFDTVNNYIPIYNIDQLKLMGSGQVVTIQGTQYTLKQGGYYKLMNDINLNSLWEPIEFAGTFDGNGHTLSNLSELFTIANGYIRNLNIVSGVIDGEPEGTAGFIAATMRGEISNCHVTGHTSGTNSNRKALGGLVGTSVNVLKIEDSSFATDIPDGALIGDSGVGGLIGTAKGDVKISGCSVTANEISGNVNIGGLVGYNEAEIKIYNSTNNSKNIKGKTNVGGIIGQSIPTGEGVKNTIVSFDEDAKLIEVYIKNKETQDFYNLNIIKVDLSLKGKQELTGAKFNIYDKNKNLIKENEEVDENGRISISNISINSLEEDVYFIEEVQAPQGYDILVNDLIRVVVHKRWDGVNSKYIIDTKITMNDNANDIEDIDDTTKTGDTAPTISSVNTTHVDCINNKTVIIGCKNMASIEASSNNAGGIIGHVKGNTLIQECTSEIPTQEGNLNSQQVDIIGRFNAGGIVGIASRFNELDECHIIDCNSNVSNIKTNSDYSAVGGIVGTTLSNTKIIGCINSSNISGTNSSNEAQGGIVGLSQYKTIISDCTNNGNVIGGTTGGIIGVEGVDTTVDGIGFNLDNSYLEIISCNVQNNIIGAETQDTMSSTKIGAGILGSTQGKEIIIKDCTVKNSTVIGNESSGVVGSYRAEQIEIEGCEVANSDISGKEAAGVICGMYTNPFGTDLNVQIKNCEVLGNNIEATSSASGIMRVVYAAGGWCRNSEINISDCYVGIDEEGKKTKISADEKFASGICGSIMLDYVDANINIENCNVKSAEISGNTDVTGIAGFVWTYSHWISAGQNTLNIDNCIVEDSELNNSGNNHYVRYGYSVYEWKCNTAGICGGIYSGIFGNVYDGMCANITNSKVIRTNMNVVETSTSGIISTMWGRNASCNVDNCIVDTVNIQYEDARGAVCAGVLGGNFDGSISISNTKVNNLTVPKSPGDVGGIIGSIYGCNENKIEISEVEVTNSEIASGDNTKNMAGIIAVVRESCVEISDITISNNVFSKGNLGMNYGGVIGSTYRCDSISNVKIENNNINLTGTQVAGGLIGVLNGRKSEIADIEINNNNIKADNGCVAGLIGINIDVEANVHDVSINNSEIVIEDKNSDQYTKFVSGCIGVGSWGVTNLENITLDNCTIGTSSNGNYIDEKVTVSGILGSQSYGKYDIKNIKINNSNIFSSNNKRTVGGVLAVCYDSDGNIEGVNIQNTQITQTCSKEETADFTGHVGGIIGVVGPSSDKKLSIKDVETNNLTITNDCIETKGRKSVLGGIIGVLTYGNSIDISDVQINNLIATGNDVVSGVIGCGIGNINNCEVNNSTITANGEFAVAGSIAGIAVENSIINNVTVKSTDTQAQEQETETARQYGVFSDNLAGGIAGINSGKLSNFKVENIIVKTTKKLFTQTTTENAEIPEYSEEDRVPVTLDSNVGTDNIPYANEVSARSLLQYINGIINNVRVIK